MSLSVQAPAGSHFDFETVKTERGQKELDPIPFLVWDDVDAATSHYGKEGIASVLDGTSLRVSFQSMGRRMRIAGKTDDEIATAMVNFRPGKRGVGESTPKSRAKSAATAAAEKVDGDVLAAFLKRVADGEVGEDALR